MRNARKGKMVCAGPGWALRCKTLCRRKRCRDCKVVRKALLGQPLSDEQKRIARRCAIPTQVRFRVRLERELRDDMVLTGGDEYSQGNIEPSKPTVKVGDMEMSESLLLSMAGLDSTGVEV